ncbi:MAG: hypothetical protein DRG50_08005 [Deltaproteobacteria bacterium]|nr:MAG: hypothetical protein DRG50_08005 [Deltaproteobacteria bacterium]
MVYLFGLADQLQSEELEKMAQRLSLPPRYRKRLIEGRKEGFIVLQKAPRGRMKPREIYTLFRPLPIEVLLYLMAKTEHKEVKKAISLFFTKLKDMKVTLRGKDLQKLGIQPGPIYREILDSLLLAHLEGKIKTREDEIKYVRVNYLAEQV